VYSAILSMNLGEVAARRGQFRRAVALVEDALAAFRAEGGRWGIGLALLTLGEIALRQGDRTVAQARLREGIALLRDLHDRLGMARGLEILAEATAVAGQSDAAARLYGAAQALREEIGAPQSVPERADRAPLLAALRARLGPDGFAAACAAGAASALDDLLGESEPSSLPTAPAMEAPPSAVAPLTRRER